MYLLDSPENVVLGSGGRGLGGLGGHFHGKFWEKSGPEAPYNYSASLGTSNFSIPLWEKPKSNISVILGPSEHDHDSQTQLFETLSAPRYLTT